MALSLEKTTSNKTKCKIKNRIENSDDSLLEIILDHKEERSKKTQKGSQKQNVKRPWDSEDSKQRDLFVKDGDYNKAKVAQKAVMKPYEPTAGLSKKESADEKLKSRVGGRASEIFSNLDF